MNLKLNISLVILIGIILFIIGYTPKTTESFNNNECRESIGPITNLSTSTHNYTSDCKVYPELLKKVLDERGMYENAKDYDMYIPCSYNRCEKDILAFENQTTGKKLYLIDGCDIIGSKLALWQTLKNYYGSGATLYMPQTYLLENKQDMDEFPQHFDENAAKRPSHMYVLKNYAQRQEGIKLSRNKDEIINGLSNGWYLVQDYMYNPLIISSRKVNFRYYLLVICDGTNIKGYIHKDGFVYYTSEFYDEDDTKFEKHITTGYIDRAVYETNPLTLDDFRAYLDAKQSGLSTRWDTNASHLMNKVMEALSTKICKNTKLNNHIRFQLFGCDLAPDDNLVPKLMEINKGPDLGAKDTRDRDIKLRVQQDIFKIIDPQNQTEFADTRFVRIY